MPTSTAKAAKPAAKNDSKSEATQPKGTKIGVVESDKRDKTRKVVIAYQSMHPKYGKYIRQRTVLHIHDEKNESKLGDLVEVAQCRPMSKTKFWRLVRVVERRSAAATALASAKEIV
ncbi:MAG: 30S ribosomal protein S17 [Phycisphaerae bacterium]|nr:30S ribosomal protein S17 [Phycisphaerae bacterium]MBN8596992.1 30S ribosomal protein S17 [Planctomycetota bacterium]